MGVEEMECEVRPGCWLAGLRGRAGVCRVSNERSIFFFCQRNLRMTFAFFRYVDDEHSFLICFQKGLALSYHGGP